MREMKSGTYILIVNLTRPTDVAIASGRLFELEPGYYAYIGSALNGLKKRIDRHLRTTKKLHWHIDYLLQKAITLAAVCVESDQKIECRVARKLTEKYRYINNFGCSDCGCESHLVYSDDIEDIKEGAIAAFRSHGLDPVVIDFT